LPFTPTRTVLYQTFYHAGLYPSVLGGFQHSWSPPLQILAGHTDAVWSVAVSPDGKQLVSGSWDRSVRLWDTDTGAEISELRWHEDWVNSVAFSPDGTRVVSGSEDATIWVWDVITTEEATSILRTNEGAVNSVAFSPDGMKIVSGSQGKIIHVWDMPAGANISKMTGHDGVRWFRHLFTRWN